MSKDPLDNVGDAIKKGVDDVKDRVHETQHRSEAEGERARRDVLGDSMTPGEKVGSIADEAKNRAQAEVDAMKRELRDRT
ncbi:MAG: hypothetical protein JOZ77_02245 [Candidatus Eremiobacteraeota bacterium]|nr:hypothetical protein [Candidatus Eremiobacteraeota bacterium]